MGIARKLVNTTAAVVLGVGGSLVVLASPAVAAVPTIQVSPAGPYQGGETVLVSVGGFTANAAVAVTLTPVSRVPPTGPGDSCASNLGCSALIVVDASGSATRSLTIVNGPINNSVPPAESCGPGNPCVIVAININDPSELVSAPVEYVGTAPPTTAPPTSPAPTVPPEGSAPNPSMTVTPAGPYKNGDRVKVSLRGFSANAPIAVALTPVDRYPPEGPGDSCSSSLGCLVLLVADVSGRATTMLTIIEGPIKNSKLPVESCDPKNDCVIAALNINDPRERTNFPVVFADAPTPTTTPTPTPTAGQAGALADSGATTSWPIAIAAVLLVLGALLVAQAKTHPERRRSAVRMH